METTKEFMARIVAELAEARLEICKLQRTLSIAEKYLGSIALSHPHLVPNEKIADNEYRLTIYD